MSRFRSRKVRSFETLESRYALAGNVQATLSGDTLTIFGDDLANEIELLPGGAGLEITGFGTTINGLAGPVSFAGVNNLTVFLGQGDDFIHINNLAFANLAIDAGNGLDLVHLGAVALPDISTQAGRDTAIADGSVGISGAFNMNMGNDDDQFFSYRVFGGATWNVALGAGNDVWNTYWTSSGNLTVNGEAGNDTLPVAYHVGNGTTTILGGDGNDRITSILSSSKGTATYNTGNGQNTVVIDTNTYESRVIIVGGNDIDMIYCAANVFNRELFVDSNSGADTVVVGYHYDESTGGNIADSAFVSIITGSGNDTVIFGNNNIQFLNVYLQDGDDRVLFKEYIYIKNRGGVFGDDGNNVYNFFANEPYVRFDSIDRGVII